MNRIIIHLILGLAAFLVTFMLCMMDYETKSAWDLFTAENFPALVIFTGFFYPVLLLLFFSLRFVLNFLRKPEDNFPGY